ncbi:MAG: CoA pyrophosphatase [Pirellulales bacterium]|nr:CoA pyrophosphatase [Pirellulales bacterium]
MMKELKRYLLNRFNEPLPGHRAQMILEPAMSYGRHRGPAPRDARRAAVMLLLHVSDDEITIPMVKRRDDLEFHAGEMAFPGGGLEDGESWEDAAIRECTEETGINAAQIEILGILTPMYVLGSRNLVMPIVGIGTRPPSYTVDKAEIERVVEVPLKAVGVDCISRTTRRLTGVDREVPCFKVKGHEICGASAMMLAELSALMSDFSR